MANLIPAAIPLAWHHLRLEIPREWEVVGFSRNADDGRLALADRDGEVLQLHWKKIPAAPNLDRRLEELARANLPPGTDPAAAKLRLEGWHDWRVSLSGNRNLPFFAARHLAAHGILLAAVFPPHPARREDVVRAVLASWTPNDGPTRAWAAFGLAVTLPSALDLEVTVSLPAFQRFEFATPKGDRVIVQRWGMLSALLADMDAAAHFARIKGRGTQVWKLPPPMDPSRNAITELALRRTPMGWWSTPRRMPKEGRAWLCPRPDLERLYAIEAWTHRDLGLPAWVPDILTPA